MASFTVMGSKTGVQVVIDAPPEHLRSLVGSQDKHEFQQIGAEFVEYLRTFCHLRQDSRVLDMGCGSGRMALPLLKELQYGTYTGVDVSSSSIDWCKEHISPVHPHFQFHCVDVKSGPYNATGVRQSVNYSFPDGPFDVVLLASVLTHLLPEAALRYIQETYRVLETGGYALMTAFLLTSQDRELVNTARIKLEYRPNDLHFWAMSEHEPEQAIAFDCDWICQSIVDAGLKIEAIKYGNWIDRAQETLSFQDILVLRK